MSTFHPRHQVSMTSEREWHVFKFGGSSVGHSIALCCSLTADEDFSKARRALVVSALGGVTNELVSCINIAQKGSEEYISNIEAVIKRHTKVVIDLFHQEADKAISFMSKLNEDKLELLALLHAVKITRNCPKSLWDIICGYGELWSSLICVNYLKYKEKSLVVEYVDAREFIIAEDSKFGKTVLWDVSQEKMDKWLQSTATITNCDIVVIPGFIASTREGQPTTLDRNSSDVSAAVVAALIKARTCVIWTDVDGVFSANPKYVKNTVLLETLSYKEALELSYFGARVLHPNAISPCMNLNIPLYIKNTFNVTCPGTKIAYNENIPKSLVVGAKGFSTIDNIALINIEGTGMVGVPGVAARVFGCLKEEGVNVIVITQGSSEQSISVGIDESQILNSKKVLDKEFYREIELGLIQEISFHSSCAILAVVGDGMIHTPGIAGKVCATLGNAGINILAIAQGSSQRNISIVIKSQDQQLAVQSVHNSFYSYLIEKPRAVLAVIGPGNVGAALLKQISNYNLRFPTNPIHVKAIARSKKMLVSEFPLDIQTWEENFEKSGVPTDLKKIEQLLSKDKLTATVAFVDTTSSEDVGSKYLHWLKYGFNVVAANKKFFSGKIEDYNELKKTLSERDVQCYYEATVGAGLPVMGPLRNMDKTGDKVIKIEGVFSGTLSYLFNQFRTGTKKFSEIVYDAVKQGYTEPDPRDDLSAMDFARKLVILSRECGLALSLEGITIHSLVEKELENVSIKEFLEKLPNYDAKMESLYQEAKKKGKVLCFIGEVDTLKKTASLTLQQIPPEHPLATLSGTENMISFHTEWYKFPLIVRGPGAGPQVTAAGVLGDILNLNFK